MKVLAVAKDAGGANAIAPVLQRLVIRPGCEVCIPGYAQSQPIFNQRHFLLKPIKTYGVLRETERDLRELAARIIAVERPDVILVGTSWGISLDKEIVVAGNQQGIPSVAVLDMWSYYRERFMRLAAEPALCYLPTSLAVMDELAYSEAIAAGIPADRMTITGQPYFDDLTLRLTSADNLHKGAERRNQWTDGRAILLFASEAIARHCPPGSLWYRGYTEHETLDMVLTLVEEMKDKVTLVIKLHPQEDAEPYAARFSGRRYPVIVKDMPVPICIAAADVVIGMTSMFLLEAVLAGKPAVSFQPALTSRDNFIGNRLGWTHAAYTPGELRTAILEALRSREVRAPVGKNQWFDGHAAERVEKLVVDLATKPAGSLTRAHS